MAEEHRQNSDSNLSGKTFGNDNAISPNISRYKPLGLQRLGMAWILVVIAVSALVTLKMMVYEWNGNGGAVIIFITNGIVANALGIWMPCYLLYQIYLKSPVGVGGILGYFFGFISLIFGSVFLFLALFSGQDDTAGYSFFFLNMTLWVGAIIATIAIKLKWSSQPRQ